MTGTASSSLHLPTCGAPGHSLPPQVCAGCWPECGPGRAAAVLLLCCWAQLLRGGGKAEGGPPAVGTHGAGQVCATEGEQPHPQVWGRWWVDHGAEGCARLALLGASRRVWWGPLEERGSIKARKGVGVATMARHGACHDVHVTRTCWCLCALTVPLQDALPDEWLLVDGPGAPQQHHPHHDRSHGSSAGRHAVPAHQQLRRGAGAANRLLSTPGAQHTAHPAGQSEAQTHEAGTGLRALGRLQGQNVSAPLVAIAVSRT